MRPLLLLCLALAGCRRADPDATRLVQEVKEGLARRDAKLQSYHLAGTVTEAGQQVRYDVKHRAPNRMLAQVFSPTPRTFAFDGERLFELDVPGKRFSTLEGKQVSPERLSQLFSPFVPDGFRAPLLPLQQLTARLRSHPRAPEAVELQARTAQLEVTYVLRYPALDFLERRSRSGEATAEIQVEEERCDLGLCVPTKLAHTDNGVPGAKVHLTTVELNPPLPTDLFTLAAPEGFAQLKP